MIAAISSNGDFYYSILQGNVTHKVFLLFLEHLLNTLGKRYSSWKDDVIFLLDNAAIYKAEAVLKYIRARNLRILYSEPYSFDVSPVEMVFANLKKGGWTNGDIRLNSK
jgi:transposase